MCDPLHVDDERVLNHRPNAAVTQFLTARAVRRPDGRYKEHTHWDLVELLRKSGEGLGARVEHFCGFPTLVSSNGVVFVYAVGTSCIVFRTPEPGFSRDLPPCYYAVETPPGWVPTYAWLGSRMDWTVREGDAAIDERFIAAAIAAEQLPSADHSEA